MFELFLFSAVCLLALDRFMRPVKDKAGRMAIKALGERVNYEVRMYDFIEEVNLSKIDYEKGIRDYGKSLEELKDIYATIKRGDQLAIDGVNALADHFGVELERFSEPEKKGIRVVKKVKK